MSMLWLHLRGAIGELRSDESGAVETAQIFAWITVTIIAIIAIGAALQALGLDVIAWVRDQIFSV